MEIMESQMVSEFILKTGANTNDAISCLKTWGWDLKRAVTDYNDTCKTDLKNKVHPTGRQNLDKCDEDDKSIIKKRPVLVRSEPIDLDFFIGRKLSRGISRATDNINLVSRARKEIAMDFHSNCQKSAEPMQSIDTPDFTFILPNLLNYPSPFQTFLEKDLIEVSTLTALEQTRRLNWWCENGICRKLWPLATTGDGNCLLHAASLGIWGFHDRKLTLRTALYGILSSGKYRDALWRRWRFQQTRFNRNAGFVYSEVEWAKEWDEIVAMASPEPRKSYNRRRVSTDRFSYISTDSIDDSATYESLEEIHILALAHILRRTIIVIADTVLRDINGEAMAPIPFGGIYLPFEIDPAECNRGPLLLAYDMAHFSALVPMDSENDYPPTLIPLTDHENVLLPIQFCIDPGEDFDWKAYDGSEGIWALADREHIALLKEYLDIIYVVNTGSPDDEIFEDLTDEEFEKKFAESEVVLQQGRGLHENETPSNKSKAAKQLQSVAKQFGSIGKNMSKKIKKNIGSITKIGGKSLQKKNTISSGGSTQSFTCVRILCAKLRVKRHEFQEEMIRNYLECASSRFLESEKTKDLKKESPDQHQMELLSIQETNKSDLTVYCINAGCNNLASSETSYLCYSCYEEQKQQESNVFLNSAPRYGTGRSKFYTQADATSHENIRSLPHARKLNDLDPTIYLSNSTFFNDYLPERKTTHSTKESFYGHGYSPTNKITESSENNAPPPGTLSVRLVDSNINRKDSINTQTSQDCSRNSKEPEESSNNYSSRIATPLAQLQARPCRTAGCMFYGTSCTNYYCSKCCQPKPNVSFLSRLTNSQTQPSAVFSTAAAVAKTSSKIMSDI